MKKRTNSKSTASFVLKRRSARNGPKARLRKFKENLFQPVDALPLGIFRFLFGFLLCLEFLVVSRETFPYSYIKPSFHFTYPLFDLLGLKPLFQPSLWLIFDVLKISTVGIMLGLFTRISLIVFTSAFGYFFFMESSVYSNHYYLIFLLSFLLCFGHSGSVFSLDSLIHKNARGDQVDYWELFLLRFQICVVFFFGAVAKLNADWLIYAAPLYLNLVKHFSFLGYPLQEKWMAVVLSWGGMLSDLGLGILLVIGRWYKLSFIWLCLFNGLNIFFFGLGIKTFPYLMISAYILFLPTPLVRKAMARFFNGHFSKYVPRLAKT
ncbi:MAG: HTTM domain-containing protein [Acidobacteriota bacterium]